MDLQLTPSCYLSFFHLKEIFWLQNTVISKKSSAFRIRTLYITLDNKWIVGEDYNLIVWLQMCNAKSKEWEARLEKGLRQWRHLQANAQPVEQWVTAAEDVLNQDGDNVDDLLTNHKVSGVVLK